MKAEYCIWSANCYALGSRKMTCEEDRHRCCHACKDKTCDCRCTDKLEQCKFRMSGDEYKQFQESRQRSFFKPPVSNNKTEVKKDTQVQMPKESPAAKQQPSETVEAKAAKEDRAIVIPHNVAELARLLGVSYDKVNYRVGWKHMTYEETYEALRKK